MHGTLNACNLASRCQLCLEGFDCALVASLCSLLLATTRHGLLKKRTRLCTHPQHLPAGHGALPFSSLHLLCARLPAAQVPLRGADGQRQALRLSHSIETRHQPGSIDETASNVHAVSVHSPSHAAVYQQDFGGAPLLTAGVLSGHAQRKQIDATAHAQSATANHATMITMMSHNDLHAKPAAVPLPRSHQQLRHVACE